MGTRSAALAVCAALSAGALAGCGGSSGNGVASKSPNAIFKSASNAITHAQSVHVSGSIVASGVPLNLDLTLVSGQGGRGQVSEGGLSFRVVHLGQTVYLYGTPAFWQHFGGATAAQRINGRWVKASATGPFASLASLTDLHRLLGSILLSHGTLTKGPTATVNGRRAVELRDQTAGGTSYYVATTGPPYPVEIKRRGLSTVRIVFDRFNQAVSLAPPANAVAVSQLG
jgi:polyisoprenoid-binding protein YceI